MSPTNPKREILDVPERFSIISVCTVAYSKDGSDKHYNLAAAAPSPGRLRPPQPQPQLFGSQPREAAVVTAIQARLRRAPDRADAAHVGGETIIDYLSTLQDKMPVTHYEGKVVDNPLSIWSRVLEDFPMEFRERYDMVARTSVSPGADTQIQ